MTAITEPTQELSKLWAWFADGVTLEYAPIYHRVCAAVAGDRDVLGLVLEAPRAAHLPPALLAAVHYLLLDGADHPLAAVYRGASAADPGPLFRDFCLTRRDDVLALLTTRRIQTNEVGRSALIGPGLSWAADRLGEPLHLVDVGCSAGLNLLCDSYLLDYGGAGATGPDDAGVRVACAATGDPPIRSRLPAIARRIGIDLDPPDVRDPDDARWLRACVWPGTGRLERTERAIALAVEDPPPVITGDAVATLPGVLDGLGGDEPVCVLTTWSFAYLPLDVWAAFVAVLERAGGRRPIAWIAGDGVGVVDLVDAEARPVERDGTPDVLSGVVFSPDGAEATLLAYVQSHGLRLDWQAR